MYFFIVLHHFFFKNTAMMTDDGNVLIYYTLSFWRILQGRTMEKNVLVMYKHSSFFTKIILQWRKGEIIFYLLYAHPFFFFNMSIEIMKDDFCGITLFFKNRAMKKDNWKVVWIHYILSFLKILHWKRTMWKFFP